MKLKLVSTDNNILIGSYDENTDTFYPIDNITISRVDVDASWLHSMSGDSMPYFYNITLDLSCFIQDIILEL